MADPAPVVLCLRSTRFRFLTGEAHLVPIVDGFPTQTADVVDNTITGFSIHSATTLFTLSLRDASVLTSDRGEPTVAPWLLVRTLLLLPSTVAAGIVEVAVDARTIASVRVVDGPSRVGGECTLSVCQEGMTLELPLDADNRATALLADGIHDLVAGPKGTPTRVVVDASCPPWLDLTVAAGPA